MSYIVQSSVSNGGTQSAPAGGTAVATIASGSLPAGTYSVTAVTSLVGGTALAADAANMGLYNGATLVAALAGPAVTVTVSMSGSNALSIKAIGVATTGVGYAATLTATLVAAS